MPVIKATEESDYSPSSSAAVKNIWSCTYTILYIVIMCFLIKHKGSFASRYGYLINTECICIFSGFISVRSEKSNLVAMQVIDLLVDSMTMTNETLL